MRELDWKSEVICVTMDEARAGWKQGMLSHNVEGIRKQRSSYKAVSKQERAVVIWMQTVSFLIRCIILSQGEGKETLPFIM